MARIKQVIKSTREIRDNVKNGEPYNLTFAPTGNLTAEEKTKLQEYLKYHYKLFTDSWIIPELDNIDEAIDYKHG